MSDWYILLKGLVYISHPNGGFELLPYRWLHLASGNWGENHCTEAVCTERDVVVPRKGLKGSV